MPLTKRLEKAGQWKSLGGSVEFCPIAMSPRMCGVRSSEGRIPLELALCRLADWVGQTVESRNGENIITRVLNI